MMPLEPVHLHGAHCTMTLAPHRPGLIVLTLAGRDIGEFGDQPMRHLEEHLAAAAKTELFIDARQVDGASIDVSSHWAQWLQEHRERFEHISMLTGSPFIRLTADFVRRFAGLGDVMWLYTDADAFDTSLRRALADQPGS